MNERVSIESLAYGGDGVGHLEDGRAVFVSGTCPGDVCDVQVLEHKGNYARGKLLDIEQAAPERVSAPCAEAASGRCGGCPWAHINYEAQLHWKRQALVDALVRIGKFDKDFVARSVGACLPSKKLWGYRNKVEFEVGQDVAGRFTLGMHAVNGPFDPLASCNLCNKKYRKAPKALTGALRFLQGGEDLGIQRVGLRVSERTGDVELALWTRTGRFPRARAAKILSDALPAKNVGVARVLLRDEAKKRRIAGVESLAGHGHWAELVGEYRMQLSAPSFFQVNTAGAETLVQLVMEGLEPSGLETVLDLYSGAGTFTLPLSEHAMSVTAVEAEGTSVRDLRRNLDKNQLYAEVVGGDVARQLPQLGVVDSAVVDPPRSGLSADALDALAATRARRIAYVSCNPSTLARDLAVLVNRDGYKLESIVPVDLFPQTYHVETVCLLVQ